jgi:soluble lytic murein transglycosylase-like protein
MPASAQIYTWRDTDGQLILSNVRPESGTDVQSYAVPRSEGARTTREAAVSRSQAYDDIIVEQARTHKIRPSLVRAVIQVESAFNPWAISDKGAMGLMQLMPATARQFGVRNTFNPSENVAAGVAYLRQLLDRYADNEQLALAAYNAGPGAVDKYGQTVPPYRETKNYVVKVKDLAKPAAAAEAKATVLYRTVELLDDGRPVVKYTDKKPEIRRRPNGAPLEAIRVFRRSSCRGFRTPGRGPRWRERPR